MRSINHKGHDTCTARFAMNCHEMLKHFKIQKSSAGEAHKGKRKSVTIREISG